LNIAEVVGADLESGSGVDLVIDFSVPPEDFRARWRHGVFASVAIFNVLEHTFDPLTVLQNALHCVGDGGALLVVTPAVWALHDHRGDYVRLMPHWYEKFAERTGLRLLPDAFCWLSEFGVDKIQDVIEDGGYQLPSFLSLGRSRFPYRYWTSRIL